MTLWFKPGVQPQELPFRDALVDGTIYTDLKNNSEGRNALGWQPAPDFPNYNPNNQRLEWLEPMWNVVSKVPESVARVQAHEVLRRRGLLAEVQTLVDSLVPTDGGKSKLYFEQYDRFARRHPLLVQLATVMGWDDAFLDAMFIEADQVT